MARSKIDKNIKSNVVIQQTSGLVSDLRFGRAVGLEFFKKNAWLIIVFIVAILSLMGLRYKTMSRMSEIKKLTIELERSESNKLQQKARYMSLIRETEMQKLVIENNINLQFQEQPPYELQLDSE